MQTHVCALTAEPIDAIDDIDVEGDSADIVTSSADEAPVEGDGRGPGKGQAAASKRNKKASAPGKGAAAQPAAQQPLPGVVQPSTQTFKQQQDEKEAKYKGYGKFYAAFGGQKEGLEACAASEPELQCCGGQSSMISGGCLNG